jgi:hypothetical protein
VTSAERLEGKAMRVLGILFLVVVMSLGVGRVRAEDRPQSDEKSSKESAAASSKPKLLEIDTDGDGKVSPQELEKSSAAEFRAYDRNADLKITEDEFTQGLMATYELMDSDSDGLVSMKEFDLYHIGQASQAGQPRPTSAATTNPDFASADADKDGMLSPNEYHSFQDACRFVLHDSNADSVIHFDEVKATAKGRFRDMDLNRDGVVTEQEYVGCSVGIPALRDRKR